MDDPKPFIGIVCFPPGSLDVDGIPPRASDVEDPSLGLVVDCIPPGASDVEDPSLELTDGVLIG